ncbi:MAG: aspartate aminotransferase family protein [Halieaceae bacterium]|nr:aspartate aminotransferase family protein [Halieaceae bacterium]
MSALMPTYARLPVTFTRGEGAVLYDTEGRAYLDGLSGIAVTNLGHAHPAITEAIQQQASQLMHTSNLYRIQPQEDLADALTSITGMERVFFGNSGAEANEAAIKLARMYGHQRGVERPSIVVLESAFHGRTMATLSATGNRKIQAGFEPLVGGFVRAARGDSAAIAAIADNNPDVVAVMVEPIQGEGGVMPLGDEYLRKLRTLCDANEWLLIYDEVQSGNGRTGHHFYYLGTDVVPDIVTTAKGLGNGMPIGACMARGKAADVFGPGHHGSTYGGGHLACAAALAVTNTLSGGDLTNRALSLGETVRSAVVAEVADNSVITDLRGQGLMIGIELTRDCTELVGQALGAGLLINVTAGNTIRLLPPLVMSKEQAGELGAGVAALINAFYA